MYHRASDDTAQHSAGQHDEDVFKMHVDNASCILIEGLSECFPSKQVALDSVVDTTLISCVPQLPFCVKSSVSLLV
jgi:hypothetical protein